MAAASPYKFVLAVDGSVHANRAVEYLVRSAAGLRSCEVHLVYALALRIARLLTPQQKDLLLQAGADTAAARRMLDDAGIAYHFHSELGNPADRIVDLARSEKCDEVIVGSRGMSALDNIALGSVAYKVVHLSPVPVTVVPNPFESSKLEAPFGNGVHRILLPVDGSEPAAKAVEYVCALRDARTPVEVRLLNVQIPIVSGNVRRFVSQDTIDAYCRAEGADALDAAKKALRSAGMAFCEDIQVGHAGEIIVREALQRGCTRIVMGTRGLGALANVMVGSTAIQVLHRSELPVTLVK
jgi:nucleotide-binding universal stress UspA family protein